MSDYTPTTDKLRDLWRRQRFWETGVKSNHDGSHPAHAEFDRWLAAIEREAAARALEEAANRLGENQMVREGDVKEWLLARAAEMREGKSDAG